MRKVNTDIQYVTTEEYYVGNNQAYQVMLGSKHYNNGDVGVHLCNTPAMARQLAKKVSDYFQLEYRPGIWEKIDGRIGKGMDNFFGSLVFLVFLVMDVGFFIGVTVLMVQLFQQLGWS